MARIYESKPASNEFQGSIKSIPYSPVKPFDPSEAIGAKERQVVEDARTVGRALARQADLDNNILQQSQAIQRAQTDANWRTVQGLLSITKTGMNLYQDLSKQREELDGWTNAWNDFAGKTELDPQEQEQQKFADKITNAETTAVAKVAAELKQENTLESNAVASTLESSTAGVAMLPIQNSIAQARQLYPLALQAALEEKRGLKGSDLMKFYNDFNRNFAKTYGLFGASLKDRAEFVRYANGIGQGLLTGVQAAAIGQERDARKQLVESTVRSKAQTIDPTNIGAFAQEAVQLLLKAQLGYQPGLVANTEAAKLVYEALAARGAEGIELIQELNEQEMAPGVTWGSQFKTVADEAIEKAQIRQDRQNRLLASETTQKLYSDLSKISDPLARRDRIMQAASELESQGQFQEAYNLRQQALELGRNQNSEFYFANLNRAIDDKEITTVEQLESYRYNEQLKPEHYEALKRKLEDRKTAQSQEVKEVVDSSADGYEARLSQVAGLKRDPTGNFIAGIQNPYLSIDQLISVSRAYRADLEKYMVDFRRQNPDLKGNELQKALRQAVTDFNNDNVRNPDGKYYVPNTTGSLALPENRGFLDKLKSLPTKLSFSANTLRATGSRDWTQYMQSGKGVGPYVKQHFRAERGDKVFTQDEVETLLAAWDKGQVQKVLQKRAQSLGMTPLALLNAQAAAYGLEPRVPEITPPAGPAAVGPVSSDPRTGLDVANYLMTRHGLPAKGAAWLTGNGMQENGSLNGQRAYWTLNDGAGQNGGMFSWNQGRLRKLERWAGRPLTQVSNAQQLDYMIREMRESYPNAWRVFSNPYATDRQLKDASFEYLGYGKEGQRFSYAKRIETQLRQRGLQAGLPQEAVQRTIAVGKRLMQLGVSGLWQHPNFDLTKGFVAQGGARVGVHSQNSAHYSGQAIDIPLSHNQLPKLSSAFDYLVRNQAKYGIRELFWNKKGFYRDGRLIGKPGSNAVPGHDGHIHIAL